MFIHHYTVTYVVRSWS